MIIRRKLFSLYKTSTISTFLVLVITLSSFSSWSIFAGGWDDENNPERIAAETRRGFEYQFSNLPTEGELSNKPWPDDYWASFRRGLALRWQGELNPVQHPEESNQEFAERSKKERYFTLRELQFMSDVERNKLSPAEKLDILNSDFNYTLTKRELARTSPDAPQWEGICHGWAPAAMHFKQPGSCVMGPIDPTTRETLVEIPFVTSDIKSLLSLMQGDYNNDGKEYFAGTRCDYKKEEDPEWEKSYHRQDINAGAFHLILANRIGILNKGFVFDRTVDAEVWNQPVEGYKTRVLKTQKPHRGLAAPGTRKEYVVETVVRYTSESEPHAQPMTAEERMDFVVEIPYQYILEVDQDDHIIGGRWISEEIPDFVWSQGKAKFKGMFKNLKKVYEKSLR